MSFIHVPPGEAASSTAGRVGVLLINLGTPEDSNASGVRTYLNEFLSDRRVIEAPPLVWKPILLGAILPFRPKKTAAAYSRIWNREHDESPLRVWTRLQAQKLAERFDSSEVMVTWGMRYGTPSLAQAVSDLLKAGCTRILAMPLYPQYCAATTATANDQLFRYLMKLRRQPAVRTLPSFPDDPAYIGALEAVIRRTYASCEQAPQMLVTSFHGMPLTSIAKGDSYAAECQRTTEALRQALGMSAEDMPLTYQSRFGPAKWLSPATADFVSGLPEKGITRIAVVMPGFVSDCIETLDEIGNELREDFVKAGGKELTLVPCLNDAPEAIDMLETLTRRELSGWL